MWLRTSISREEHLRNVEVEHRIAQVLGAEVVRLRVSVLAVEQTLIGVL